MSVNSVSAIQAINNNASAQDQNFWSEYLAGLSTEINAIQAPEDQAYQVSFGYLYSLLSIVDKGPKTDNPNYTAAENLFSAYKAMQKGGSKAAVLADLKILEGTTPSSAIDLKAAMENILMKKMVDEAKAAPSEKNINHLAGYVDVLNLIQKNAASLGLPSFDLDQFTADYKAYTADPSAATKAALDADLSEINQIIQG